MKYVRLCRGFQDKGILIPESEVFDRIDDKHDWYQSAFEYSQDQYEKIKEAGSVRGIDDVTTDKIFWDFDSKENPELALEDARKLVQSLDTYEDPEIYFSGSKGFHVIVQTNKSLNPEQVAHVAQSLAGNLKTLDLVVYNASRILRVPGTRHQKTGLFKFPLTKDELLTWDLGKIKNKAVSLDNANGSYDRATITLTEQQVSIPKKKQNEIKVMDKIDLSNKPTHWKPYKWALAQGYFESGERHNALMVIAATCRGLGYDKETTYYICKSALKKQAARTGSDEFPKEELYKNIIEDSIFSDNWEGGQYSPKNNVWLAKYCERMGIKVEDEVDDFKCVGIMDMESVFADYAKNFEQNIVKTGIKGIDDNVLFLASTHNGVLGAPGAGKTAFSLEYLKNTSKAGIPSVFLSLDMGLPQIFAKLGQKAKGMDFKQIMRLYKDEPEKARRLTNEIFEEYRNVNFNFKAGLSVGDIKKIIKNEEDRTGQKVKLLITDYLECLAGPFSDATANTGFICQQLKDLANELQLCSVLLLQTQKHSTGEIADPLLSMRQIKGSSVIEQSCSTVLTLWREGYSPDTVNDDKYISFALVKNRFGSLWRDDFGWHGKTGDISELTEEQHGELAAFKERKKLAKLEAEGKSNKGWE